jgi:diguanylate cyclase (GGDEF)-like protein
MNEGIGDGKIGYSSEANFAPNDILYMLRDLPDACCIFKVLTDPFGTVKDMLFLFANEKYAAICGKPIAELIGNTFYKTVTNMDEDWIKFSYQAAILRQSSINRTYNTRMDKWYEFWAVPVYQKGFCAFIIHDVTTAKRDEDNNIFATNTSNVIIECAKELTTSEFHKGVKKVLKRLGQTIEADRVFVAWMKDRKIEEIFEWMSNTSTLDLPLRRVFEKYDIPMMWDKQLQGKNVVMVDDTSCILDANETVYHDILAGRVSRYMVTVLKDKKDIIGYLVADNYSINLQINVAEVFESVAIFLAAEMRNHDLNQELMYLGSHDALTGLGNRYALNQALNLLSGMKTCVGVCYSDINGLKSINDSKGHEYGDQIIKDTAEIFASIFKKKYCYRIGGDEFIAIVPEIDEVRFNAMVQKLESKTKKVSIAIGHVWTSNSSAINKAVKNADEAMYSSKADYYESHERRQKNVSSSNK